MTRRERGVALILVLWLIALLTALVGAFALSARVEAGQDSVLRSNARAQSVTRAGLEYALWRMRGAPATRWQADGRPYDWSFDGVPVQVRIVDEGGKVDLNNANPALLAGLMRALDVEPGRAQAIAAAIVDWRDRDSLQAPGGAEDRITPAPGGLTGPRTHRSRAWASCAWCLAWMPISTGGCCPMSPCTPSARSRCRRSRPRRCSPRWGWTRRPG